MTRSLSLLVFIAALAACTPRINVDPIGGDVAKGIGEAIGEVVVEGLACALSSGLTSPEERVTVELEKDFLQNEVLPFAKQADPKDPASLYRLMNPSSVEKIKSELEAAYKDVENGEKRVKPLDIYNTILPKGFLSQAHPGPEVEETMKDKDIQCWNLNYAYKVTIEEEKQERRYVNLLIKTLEADSCNSENTFKMTFCN